MSLLNVVMKYHNSVDIVIVRHIAQGRRTMLWVTRSSSCSASAMLVKGPNASTLTSPGLALTVSTSHCAALVPTVLPCATRAGGGGLLVLHLLPLKAAKVSKQAQSN